FDVRLLRHHGAAKLSLFTLSQKFPVRRTSSTLSQEESRWALSQISRSAPATCISHQLAPLCRLSAQPPRISERSPRSASHRMESSGTIPQLGRTSWLTN